MYECLLCGTREVLLLAMVKKNGSFGEAISEAQIRRQEVGQVNSSEEACEQSRNTAEWVERSDLTERKLS